MNVEHFVRWDQRVRPKTYREGLRNIKRCEVKLDGFRVTVCRDTGKSVFAAGRKAHGEDLWPKMLESVLADDIARIARLPARTVLDGELYIEGDYASEVSRALADGEPVLRYQPFAVPFAAGVDCRSCEFERRDELLHCMGFSTPQSLSIWPDRIEDLNVLARELGVEGFVLKQAHYRGWWKTKPRLTSDLIVVGSEPGRGKHDGRLGALHLAYVDLSSGAKVSAGKVGIGNDAEWRDLSDVDVLNRVVEVEHEGVQSNGALRFPRFVRWRDDKDLVECDGSDLK